jgi:hypothetical protein
MSPRIAETSRPSLGTDGTAGLSEGSNGLCRACGFCCEELIRLEAAD